MLCNTNSISCDSPAPCGIRVWMGKGTHRNIVERNDSMVQTREEDALDFESAQAALFGSQGVEYESSFLDLDAPSVGIHLFEAGNAHSRDPPLFFVHGTAAFGAFLAPLMGQLDSYRLVGFDRPGYGLSDPYQYETESFRRVTIETIEGILDSLDLDRVDLIGHSMGGFASLEFARTHPSRVRTVSLIGAIPTFPGTSPPVPIRLASAPVVGRVVERFQKTGEEGVLDIAGIFGERDSIQDYPELIRAIAAHEADPKARAAGKSEFRALMTLRGWRPSMRLRGDQLRAVQAPTTMVWGTYDPLGRPAEARSGVDLLQDVRFRTVEAGHMPFLAHPRECAEAVRHRRDEHAATEA